MHTVGMAMLLTVELRCCSSTASRNCFASGEARKGDLVFFYPFNPYSTDCHIGFFWGDTPYENRFWHSFRRHG